MNLKHLIFLFCALYVVNAEEGGGGWDESLPERTASFLIVTSLILISILFEFCKDKLEEKVSNELSPIIKALYGELMIGGFLSLLTFALVQSGLLTDLSEKALHEKTLIPELVEKIHVLLFLVFVIYLIEILFLLAIGIKIQKRWRKFEKLCKKPHKIVNNYLEALKLKASGKVNFFYPRNYSEYYWNERAMQYLVLRHLFVNHKSLTEKKLPADFDFSEYLSIVMGKTIGKIVEIPFYGWLALDVIFFIFWGVSGFSPAVQVIAFIIGGFVLPFLFFLVYRKLLYIRSQLLIPLPRIEEVVVGNVSINNEGEKGENEKLLPSLNRRTSIWINNNDEMTEEHHELLNKKENWSFPAIDPAYNEITIQPRSSIGKFFLGYPPCKQEALFPFDKKGPKFLLLIVTLVTFVTAIYISLFGYSVAGYIYKLETPIEVRILLWILCLAPLAFCAVYFTPSIIAVHSIVSNIEQLKSHKIITKVLRVMRTKKTVRILKVLNSLKGYVKSISINKEKEEEEHHHLKKKNSSHKLKKKQHEVQTEDEKEELEQEKLREMKEIFALFDTSGDGTVDAEELCAFLGSLGHKISTNEAEVIIQQYGKTAEGGLNFEEFHTFMKMTQTEEEMDEEELVETIFDLFDKDKDGQITIEEFQNTLNMFGHPLTHSEVAELVHDLDKNGDGEICKEEFEHLFKKFSQHY